MTSSSTTEDLSDIIRTIHEWRRQMSDHFAGNLAAMVEDANRRTALSGRRILRRGELTNTPMQPSGEGLAADTTQPTPVAK